MAARAEAPKVQELEVRRTDTFDHYLGKVKIGENGQWGLEPNPILYLRREGRRIAEIKPLVEFE